MVVLSHTVNVERFTGLNFCGFQEYCECFSMNIAKHLSLIMLRNKGFCMTKAMQNYFHKTLNGDETANI